jgi:alkylation response protein AidB-like acyl-CoA dehydrogenase
LVTVDVEGARQLLLLDLQQTPPEFDTRWWRVSGMQRSETHRARWQNVAVDADICIGKPGDYVREPWFSGGAIRFAAVQAGAIAAVVDHTRDHLVAQQRDSDPHQRARLADLYRAAQSAADAVAQAAEHWSLTDVAATLAHVSAARAAVYAAGETVLTIAQAAIGVQAMFVEHPVNAVLTDLSTYLRQPGPDAQRDRVGEAVASGLLRPCL